MLRMMPSSFGANRPLIFAPPPSPNAPSVGVQLADLSLWNADCGNELGLMLSWNSGPGSTVRRATVWQFVRETPHYYKTS